MDCSARLHYRASRVELGQPILGFRLRVLADDVFAIAKQLQEMERCADHRFPD